MSIAVNFPDGMMGLKTIQVGGPQHLNMRIFRESNVNNMFRDAQIGQDFQGIMFGDKAYTYAWPLQWQFFGRLATGVK